MTAPQKAVAPNETTQSRGCAGAVLVQKIVEGMT